MVTNEIFWLYYLEQLVILHSSNLNTYRHNFSISATLFQLYLVGESVAGDEYHAVSPRGVGAEPQGSGKGRVTRFRGHVSHSNDGQSVIVRRRVFP